MSAEAHPGLSTRCSPVLSVQISSLSLTVELFHGTAGVPAQSDGSPSTSGSGAS